MPKGEKVLAKAKGPHHHPYFKKSFFKIGILLCSKGEIVAPSKLILKPSWTLRGGFYWGGVLFSQRKSIWSRGRKFQILKMLRKILFIYLWLFAKGFTKEFAKTKHVVQVWSKMLKIKRNNPCISYEFILAQFKVTFALTIMQTKSFMHFYICFGLCWHQSPKRGRLKGN
jgi:hypothetical protein